MSKIKGVIALDRIVNVDYEDIEGFKVKLAYISRDELTKLRNRCVTYKFSKQTRQREEEIDSEKFLKQYTKKVIKGWSGLYYKDLHKLIPVDLSGENPEEEIYYTEEDAYDLISSSTVFDQFITDQMANIETFELEAQDKEVKN